MEPVPILLASVQSEDRNSLAHVFHVTDNIALKSFIAIDISKVQRVAIHSLTLLVKVIDENQLLGSSFRLKQK